MRKVFIFLTFLLVSFLVIRSNLNISIEKDRDQPEKKSYQEISGIVKKGETLFDIFKRYRLGIEELFILKEASANIHRLRNIYPGQPYKIIIDDNKRVNSFIYWINDDSVLKICRTESGFCAEKKAVEYEKRILHLGGVIKDNLISSMGTGREGLALALQLSDIFAWDIDFTTDLRNGDTFKIVVEGFYLNEELKKYGDILSAEISNRGETYRAYRFELNGKADYYDPEGKSLRKAFLKAPLSFRRVSSGFSINRFHPVLKIYRPHYGIDYAAPMGIPVSVIGDGMVVFAGKKGQYGNLVIIKHPNGYKTYYGHLSRFGSGIKKRIKVKQGQVIGYVGSTGLATGPHLHYEMRIKDKPVNPFSAKPHPGAYIPKRLMAEFSNFRNQMDARLTSISLPVFAFAGKWTGEE